MQPRTDRRRRNPFLAYLPFIVIVVVIALVAAFFAVRDGDDGNEGDGGGGKGDTTAGPLLFEQAQEQGLDTSQWPNCDQQTGRVAIPLITAAPCVEPFDGDNGGATATGVSAEEIKIVVYLADPKLDPLQTAFFSQSGADVGIEPARELYQGYFDLFNEYYEMFGRKVVVEYFVGTGAPDDEVKAKADGIAVADMKPFAVLGGPSQAVAFRDELVARGVVCIQNCALATPDRIVASSARDGAPSLMWQYGPSPDQANLLAAEMVGTQLAGGEAEYGGDAVRSEPRVFGYLWYDAPDGHFKPGHERLVENLEENQGVDLAADLSFTLDLALGQETASTLIAQMKAAGVTTILISGDPIMPTYFTRAATEQDYFPEWVIMTSVYIDTAIFGRQYDPEQWKHALGLSLQPTRGAIATQTGYRLYRWWKCTEPPSNLYGAVYSAPVQLFTGLQLAGADLTPATYAEGLFRYPPTGGTPAIPLLSWGNHGFWPDEPDLSGTDDGTLIWWDPNATGPDETSNMGTGMWAYADGGTRYRLGEFPDDPVELFDPETSVTFYEELPPEDVPPEYPSPCE